MWAHYNFLSDHLVKFAFSGFKKIYFSLHHLLFQVEETNPSDKMEKKQDDKMEKQDDKMEKSKMIK